MNHRNPDLLGPLWHSDATSRDIAARFGVSTATIYKSAKMLGFKLRSEGSYYDSPAFRQAWHESARLQDVADNLGVHYSVVHKAGLRRGFMHRNFLKARQ